MRHRSVEIFKPALLEKEYPKILRKLRKWFHKNITVVEVGQMSMHENNIRVTE